MMTQTGAHGLEVLRVRSDGRRCYEPASKERLVEACLQPGVSVAGLALQHGVNTNLLRKWIVQRRQAQSVSAQPGAAQLPDSPAFVRVNTPPARAASGALIDPPGMERVRLARLQASLPNGVMLTLEGCDPQLVAVMIGALGRCDVPPVA